MVAGQISLWEPDLMDLLREDKNEVKFLRKKMENSGFSISPTERIYLYKLDWTGTRTTGAGKIRNNRMHQ
jgi:hypothetical protein